MNKRGDKDLSLGNSYLIKGKTSDKLHEIFKEKINAGFSGLCITRTNPSIIKEIHGSYIPVVWLSSHRNENSESMSDIDSVLGRISDFVRNNKNSVIFLERIDYLINMHGFENTLRFIYRLNDIVSATNSMLLLHINPDILSKVQLTMIEQEINGAPQGIGEMELTDDLQEIIEFVNAQRSMSKAVSFKDVTRKFSITKSTARKRINRLHNLNLVGIKKNGRFKIVTLAEKASN